MLWAVNSNGGIVREYLEEQDVVFNNGRPTDSEANTRSPMQNYINGYSMTNGYSAFLDENDKNRNISCRVVPPKNRVHRFWFDMASQRGIDACDHVRHR
jgi:hypothetical protein